MRLSTAIRLLPGRILQALVQLLFLSIIVFAVAHAIGNPVDLLIGPGVTKQQYASLVHSLGLDRSIWSQYWVFLDNLLHGNLGTSLQSDQQVSTILGQRLQASLLLGSIAFALAVAVGVPLGVLAAQFQRRWIDRGSNMFAAVGLAAPAFFVGMVLIQVFSVKLGWFPGGGDAGWRSIPLPAITLAIYGIAVISRLVRTSMLEVLGSEYVAFARANGIHEGVVVWKHALRNASLPVVSYGGIFFVNTLTLSTVVEVVFAWPGLGQLTYTAILGRDFPVIQGVVLLAGVFMIVTNIVVDLAYGVLDPTIRV